jgi:hypothetical protein
LTGGPRRFFFLVVLLTTLTHTPNLMTPRRILMTASRLQPLADREILMTQEGKPIKQCHGCTQQHLVGPDDIVYHYVESASMPPRRAQ